MTETETDLELVLRVLGGRVVEPHVLIHTETGVIKRFYPFGIDQVRVDTQEGGVTKTEFFFKDKGRKVWKGLVGEGFIQGIDKPEGS